MTPQQLIGLGIRLFAIWLGLTSIAYFTSIPAALALLPSDSATAITYALGGAYIFGAVALWFFPMVVSHKLLPRTQYENHLNFQERELARVGICLLGLWLFAKVAPTLTWFLLRSFIYTEASTSSYSGLSPDTKIEVAVAAFQAGLALFFVFKAGVIAGFVCAKQSKREPGENDL
jgi:hypothetical protein